MSLASWLEFKSTNKIFGKVFFEVLHSFLCRHQKDQLPDGLPAKVMADQEPWFLFKTSNRNRKKQESEERTPAGICNLAFLFSLTTHATLLWLNLYTQQYPITMPQLPPSSSSNAMPRGHFCFKYNRSNFTDEGQILALIIFLSHQRKEGLMERALTMLISLFSRGTL